MWKNVFLFVAVWAAVVLLTASLTRLCPAAAERIHEETDRIWIREFGEFVPFLVLENTEQDMLVIREHTTGPCAFTFPDSLDCYYADSALDRYLNTEYATRFSPGMNAYFLESEVEITAQFSIGVCGTKTEIIRRVFFVPSWTETTGRHNSVCLQEGALFPEGFRRSHLKAVDDTGEPSAWWLRTPNTWYTNIVLGISEDGGVFSGSTGDGTEVYAAFVRPVFRISAKVPVTVEGGEIYIAEDNQ